MVSDIKSAIKNTLIYGLSNLSTKIVGLILLPLYSIHLSIEEYGVLAILEVTSQVLIAIFSLSMGPAFFRWYYEKEYLEKQKSLFYTIIVSMSCMAVIMFLSLSFLTNPFSTLIFNSPQFSNVLKLMLASTAMEIVLISPNLLMRLQEKPALFAITNIIKLFISLIFTLIFIIHFNRKIDGIYEAQLIGQLVYFAIISCYIIKNITPVFNKKALYEMLVFSFPFILSSIASIGFNMSDRYILSFFGTMKDVGQYSLGYKMANTIWVFIVSSVNMAILPMMYKMIDAPNRMRFYSKVMTYYTFGLMFFVLGMSFFGKEIVKVFARNPNYWNSYIVIPVISFSILFIMLKDTAMIGLQIAKKSKIIASIIVTISIFNILINILFISLFKTLGAAYATLTSQIVYFALVYKLSQKYYPIPFELKKVFIIIFTGVILYIFASLTNDSSLFIRLSIKTFLIVSFPVILYFLNFYEPIELISIKGAIKKWRKIDTWNIFLKKLFNF